MIVVDSSVFVAILQHETEAAALSRALALASERMMSAATYLECAMIAEGRFGGRAVVYTWLTRRDIGIHPVDHALAQRAADAFARYGKGRHPAGLNFGDCFSYALAQALGAPLLFKGNDFSRTDIAIA
ncbi:type II toxin-antitoxin system VapC family toxin [Methylobacterium sp. Leaf466]|uniref:type II toxin-antitoxin system VapC family toxin n=1 Tax=Methylobacterium sp. Leaf466 TaxID=1736386 RepID=UPI000A8EF870